MGSQLLAKKPVEVILAEAAEGGEKSLKRSLGPINLVTLLAFTIVCLSVWVMRAKRPDIPRPFRTPWVPWVPIFGMVISLSLMLSLDLPAWIVFGCWLVFGLMIYFGYSRKHSSVQKNLASSGQSR